MIFSFIWCWMNIANYHQQDPHMGTMMSIDRLRTICIQAMESNPDLIILTGDFFTVEAYDINERALIQGLEPLKSYQGKTFACLGVSHSLMLRFILDDF